MFSTTLQVLLAVSALHVHAIRFDGPPPTPVPKSPDLINGRSPKPTADPHAIPQMFRRQDEIDNGICGYIDGNPSSSVSCTVGNCMYNVDLNWFGCCTGSVQSDCAIATTCIASASISSCLGNPSCVNDDYATGCNDSDRPFCAEMSSVATDGTVTHLVCAATATQVELLPTESGGASSTRVSAANNGTASASSRSTSSRRVSSSAEDEEEDATSSSRSATSTRLNEQSTRQSSATQNAATSSQSTGGAVKTAQAVAGAGGVLGLLALFL